MNLAPNTAHPRIELNLNFQDLSPAQREIVEVARKSLSDGYAPQTLNHRAAVIADRSGKTFGAGSNTDSTHRGKQCAEVTAVSKARVLMARDGISSLSPGTLAVISERFFLACEHTITEPPTAPCGACLSHIQAQRTFTDIANLTVVMGANQNFRRAFFSDLYPMSTVAQLQAAIAEPANAPTGFALLPPDACCQGLTDEYLEFISQERFNFLFEQTHKDLEYSSILTAPNLKIAYGYLTAQNSGFIRTAPLIDENTPIGQVGGVLSLCASSKPSRNGPQQIKGFLIAIDLIGDSNEQSDNYQFFPGTERQRVFDLAQLTDYDIPIFISWRRKSLALSHISTLAPLYEGPKDSKSTAPNLKHYL